MPVAFVQKITGSGATLVLNGVVAGNALVMVDAYYRSTSTQVAEAVPTDSNGTFLAAVNDVPALNNGASSDAGSGIFYEQNANSGTHTITPQANSSHQTCAAEFSGLSTSAMFTSGNKNSGKTANFAGTSQVTNSTGAAAAVGDLAIIVCAIAAVVGAADVGWTDPVSGYTTLLKSTDDLTTMAHLSGYNVLGSSGTQSATFNWTDTESNQSSQASIATFNAAGGAAGPPGPPLMGAMML